METLAIVILVFYAIGYFVLGGADIGAGMLIPILGRDRGERRLVVATIVPFFLTNEVWLIATAGVLIGLFPVLEGDLLSGLFPLFVALLAGWVSRDIGVWFRGRVDGDGRGARAWRAGCDAVISAGSWIVAGSWGWIFAGLLAGVTDRVVTEPVVVVAVVAVMTVFALHGLAFVALRSAGELRRRSLQWFGASGEQRTFAVTSAVMAALTVVAGSNLALTETVADAGTLGWLVPAILVITPFLVAAQVWVWRLCAHRIVLSKGHDGAKINI
ncbi:cytochrome d ubiquinol oxidase subunit II [Phytoactinopolyspora mesophila]|uniref:Cytochrome d ubiquinol oxidase subunit II n=1 Tax=Phytoactinopolyspora mesophila TaxID=2650750 RepID=A0A7K3LZ43_9ACTN|nr:cytochrome d ubiquinol oxidase subunit II [Phytoactinopolyspora mesophila]NDL56294.1 cytochrome d ubiquinol oxidase subunit II [Phytoactinopolyspora mesophila]